MTKTLAKLPQWYIVVPILLIVFMAVSMMLDAGILSRSEQNTIRNIMTKATHPNPETALFDKTDIYSNIYNYSSQHVPFFYYQLSFWVDLVGFNYILLRVISLFHFLLTCAFVFRLASSAIDVKFGVLATLFVAFCPYHMYYAREIRMYAPVVTAMTGLIWSYWHIVLSGKKVHWYHWLNLFFWTFYGLHIHMIMIFPLSALGAYHLFLVKKDKKWLSVSTVICIAVSFILPLLPQLLIGTEGVENANSTTQTSFEMLWNSLFIYSNGFWVGGIILVGIFLWKRALLNRHLRFVSFIFITMLLTLIIFNEALDYVPFRRMRYTIILLPVLSLIWGWGFYYIYQHWRRLAFLFFVAWIVMTAWFSQSEELYAATNLSALDYNGQFPVNVVGDYLRDNYSEFPSELNWLVSFHSIYQDGYSGYYELVYERPYTPLRSYISERDVAEIDNIKEDYPGFWFSYRKVDEPQMLEWQSDVRMQPLFENHTQCIRALDNDDLVLDYYVQNTVPCELFTDLERERIIFDNDYILRDYVLMQTDSGIDVSLWWETPDLVYDNAYGYSLQVFRDGEKVGQSDLPVHNTVTLNSISLDDLGAGSLSVHLILYSSDDVESVGGEVTESGVIFERDIELGQVDF